MTLNSFHTAGTSHAGVTMGIPRLKEIMSCSKQIRTPQTTLEFPDASESQLKSIAAQLSRITLGQVTETMEVRHEPYGDTSMIIEEDVKSTLKMDTYFTDALDDPSEHVGVLQLNKHMLIDYNIIPADIAKIITSLSSKIINSSVHVTYSEVNTIQWWVRVRVLTIKTHYPPVISDEKLCERGFVLRFAKLLCNDVILGGVAGIEAAAVDTIERWNGFKNVKVPVIQTRSNILQKAGAIKGVEWETTMTNDINVVVNTLGIEAATTVIFNEMYSTLTADGSYMDPRHVELTANTMTVRGYLMPLNRHGLNNLKTGPLTRSSFEETSEVLKDAAIFGESETVSESVSAAIMLGQVSSMGTGRFEVRIPKPDEITVKKDAPIVKTTGGPCYTKHAEEICFLPRDDVTFVDRVPFVPYSPKR